MERLHLPVLLEEAVSLLEPGAGRVIVDATVGLGGHAEALLKRGARVVGLDLDPANLGAARGRLERVLALSEAGKAGRVELGGEFTLKHGNFAAILSVLRELGIERVDGILADLGVSSPHFDDPSRGFSFRHPGPLDMRLDPTQGPTAAHLVNRMGERELADALFRLGDETDSRRIARLIVERRKRAPIRTTEDLTEIVCAARRFTLQRATGAKLHPATRTFQALRILVNREMENLDRLLMSLPECLKPRGIAVIISFHSGEDRRVKQSFRDGLRGGVYSEISKKVVKPSADEQGRNPRARSARLRWARR